MTVGLLQIGYILYLNDCVFAIIFERLFHKVLHLETYGTGHMPLNRLVPVRILE